MNTKQNEPTANLLAWEGGSSKWKRMLKVSIEVPCNECQGDGYYEAGPECTKPAWDCCGGCYRKYECDVCSGKGRLTYNLDAEQIGDMVYHLGAGEVCEAQRLLKDCQE